MAIPERGPQWWDREFDDLGNPIRADVREAAHEIWPICCGSVRAALGDAAEAPELMEAAVSCISRHLNRAGSLPSPGKVRRLLGLHFSQLLYKRASKLGRIQFVGTAADLDNFVSKSDTNWVNGINLWLDFEKIRPFLSLRNFTMFFMRSVGHEWDDVGKKLGMEPAEGRASLWRSLHKARNIIEGKRTTRGDRGGSNT